MKILNNTTGNMYYSTQFTTADGQNGGDCGNIAPNSPPFDYPIAEFSNVSVAMSFRNITYTDLTNDMFLTITSGILTDSKK